MRAKSLLLLIIALGCGTVASVGISQVMMDQRGQVPNEVPMAEVFVAIADIDVNQRLTPKHVRAEKWPLNRVPEGSISKLEDLKDRYVRQRMYPGEPILASKLNAVLVGVDTEIPRGYRVFDLPVNERNGGSGYIKPGARVDVLGTFKVNGLTQSRIVMRNVRIFGINGVTVRDNDSSNTNRATTFQLLIHESQMEALNLATAMGELRCTLRGTIENMESAESTDTGEAFMAWVRGVDAQQAGPELNSNDSDASNSFADEVTGPLQPAAKEKKKQLLIITPNGVTKYTWSKVDELPQLEVPESDSLAKTFPIKPGQTNGQSGEVDSKSTETTSKDAMPDTPSGDSPTAEIEIGGSVSGFQ